MNWFGILLIEIIFAIGCAVVADRQRRNSVLWFFLGLLFGPIAFIIVMLIGDKRNDF